MKKCFASVLALFMALPVAAVASVSEVNVGGSVSVSATVQKEFDLQENSGANKNDYYFTETIVSVAAKLTDDVDAYVELINERKWGDATASSYQEARIQQSYAALSGLLDRDLTLKIGKQNLKYGEGFLISDGEANTYGFAGVQTQVYSSVTTRRASDAIRLSLLGAAYKLDLFTAKVDETFATDKDSDLYGFNLQYVTESEATLDLGIFSLNNDTTGDETNAVSLRARKGDVLPNFALKGELVKEFGDSGTADLDAWGGYAGASYMFENDYQPYLSAQYIFMSGDEPGGDDERFNTLFEGEVYGYINEQLANALTTNLGIINLTAGLAPTSRTAVRLDYYNYTVDEQGTAPSDNYGSEYDLTLVFAYTEDVQFSVTAALFDPDDYFGAANDEATQLSGGVSVTF